MSTTPTRMRTYSLPDPLRQLLPFIACHRRGRPGRPRRTAFEAPPPAGLPAVARRWRDRSRRATAGADDRTRTGDLVLTKDALYLLSYIGPPSRSPAAHERDGGQARVPSVCPSPRLNGWGGWPLPTGSPPSSALLPVVAGEGWSWSGRRGSNPRPTAWKAVTLPLSYSRLRDPCTLRHGGHARPRVSRRRSWTLDTFVRGQTRGVCSTPSPSHGV